MSFLMSLMVGCGGDGGMWGGVGFVLFFCFSFC